MGVVIYFAMKSHNKMVADGKIISRRTNFMESAEEFTLSAVDPAQVTEAVYALQTRAEEHRAELEEILAACSEEAEGDDAILAALEQALPEDVELDGRLLLFSEEDGARVLTCALELLPSGSPQRTAWAVFDLTAETEDDSWNW